MIRVLVAEDSRTVRELIESILADDPEIEIVGRAANGVEAVRLAKELKPDVITMDVNMPIMSGLDATREIMTDAPTRIIIISGSIDSHEVEVSMNALRMGAISVMQKPLGPGSDDFAGEARRLVAMVKNLAGVKVIRRRAQPGRRIPASSIASPRRAIDAIGIGTSTGGPATLAELLGALPEDFAPPILVVQHIARGFVHGMASWLNGISPVRVKVAVHGETLAPRTVYLAEDDHHLGVGTDRTVELSKLPLNGGFRPSVNHLFDSLRETFGTGAAGVLLTGMGRDGADGLLRLRQGGSVTISQSRQSCIVYGMPREAELLEASGHVLETRAIAALLIELATAEGARS